MDEVRKESRLIVDASLFQDAAFVIGELLQLVVLPLHISIHSLLYLFHELFVK